MRSIVAVAFMVAAFLFVLHGVSAHQAPSGWQYPLECCSDHDCAPIADADIPRPLDGGDWLLTTGEVVLRSKVKWSPDGHYHLCRMGEVIFCLFVPPQGS